MAKHTNDRHYFLCSRRNSRKFWRWDIDSVSRGKEANNVNKNRSYNTSLAALLRLVFNHMFVNSGRCVVMLGDGSVVAQGAIYSGVIPRSQRLQSVHDSASATAAAAGHQINASVSRDANYSIFSWLEFAIPLYGEETEIYNKELATTRSCLLFYIFNNIN